jgi:hypothetical protein
MHNKENDMNRTLRRRMYSKQRRQEWKQLLERELGLYFADADLHVHDENSSTTTHAALLT